MTRNTTLPNGLTLVYTERADSPVIACSLRFIAGSMHEADDEVGLAHFVEHLLFDGTKKYPSKQLQAKIVDDIGAFRNALTNKESIECIIKVLRGDLETALEFLSQETIEPLLSEDDIAKEKNVIEQEINRFKSMPEEYAPRLVFSLLYPGTSYGRLNTGDVEDIKKITRPKVVAYWQRMFTARNAVLSVVGDIPFDKLYMLVEKYFGHMTSGTKTPPLVVQDDYQKPFQVEIFPGVKQAYLTIAWRGFRKHDREDFALGLIGRALNQGHTSRLYRRLRGEKAMTYTIIVNRQAGRNIGDLQIRLGVANGKVHECLEIIREEIQKLCSEPMSAEELQKALKAVKAGTAFRSEDSLELASFFSALWMTDELRSMEQELAIYESVAKDPQFVQKTAQKIFSKDPSILVISNKDMDVHW